MGNLVRSQRDETVAGFELKSAIGQLTARNLELPVKLYDFERNYRAVRDKWFGSGKRPTEDADLPPKPGPDFEREFWERCLNGILEQGIGSCGRRGLAPIFKTLKTATGREEHDRVEA